MEKDTEEENRDKIFNESRNLSAHVHNMFDREKVWNTSGKYGTVLLE
jgi:hypothetical protein